MRTDLELEPSTWRSDSPGPSQDQNKDSRVVKKLSRNIEVKSFCGKDFTVYPYNRVTGCLSVYVFLLNNLGAIPRFSREAQMPLPFFK